MHFSNLQVKSGENVHFIGILLEINRYKYVYYQEVTRSDYYQFKI